MIFFLTFLRLSKAADTYTQVASIFDMIVRANGLPEMNQIYFFQCYGIQSIES